MRVTTIRFNLKFFNANGGEEVVRTLDDLRSKFNLSDLCEYLKAGDLTRWLRGLNETRIAAEIESLRKITDRRVSLNKLNNLLCLGLDKISIAEYCDMLARQNKMKNAHQAQVHANERVSNSGSDMKRPTTTIRKKDVIATCNMHDMTDVRSYLKQMIEKSDEQSLKIFLCKVVKECIVYHWHYSQVPIVLMAIIGNKMWRDILMRFFEVKANIHVHGGNHRCRNFEISVFSKDISDSQLQGSPQFEFGDYFPPYFPVFGFNFDVIADVFIAESFAVENPMPPSHDFYRMTKEDWEVSYVEAWKREYVSPRWGTNVPSWELRSAEAEELLRSWWKKHIYWE